MTEGVITRAEARVLHELMRDGATNRTIARRLNLSEDTVKVHMKRLLAAGRSASRTEFVVAVFRGDVRLRICSVRGHRAVGAPGIKDIDHGTYSGFMTHHRRDVPMCDDCRAAGDEHIARMVAGRWKDAA